MAKKKRKASVKNNVFIPKISVIIFSYNFENFLEECIESILNQTLKPYEIIICDDHSTDGSWDIIQKYADIHKAIIRSYRHDENLGNVKNGAFARAKVRGNLQSEIDGDDKWQPEKLEREWAALKANPKAKVAYSNVLMCNMDGKVTDSYINTSDPEPPTGDVFVNVFAKRFFARNRAIYRNELIYHETYEEFKRDPEIGVYSDWDLKIRVTSEYPVVYSGDALVYYRNHPGGIHNLHRKNLYKSASAVVEKNKHLIDSRTTDEQKYILKNIEEFLVNEYKVSHKKEEIFKSSPTKKDEAVSTNSDIADKLIFLISQPRAGSTLLQRVLGGHSQVHTVAEPWVMLHPLYALKNEGIQTEYGANYALQALTDFVNEMPNGKNDYINGISKMANEWYSSILSGTDKPYFLDKTPRYYYILDELQSVFPVAKKIILLRNPLAVLSSILETWVQDDWNRLQLHRDDLLKAPMFISRQLAGVNKNCIIIHYEEMVRNPDQSMKDLCAKLGIRYEPAMLNYGDKQAPKGRMGDAVGINKYKNPVQESLNKWRNAFTKPSYKLLAEIYLELLGEKTIDRMGYSFKELRTELEKIEIDGSLEPREIKDVVVALNLSPEKLSAIEPVMEKYLKRKTVTGQIASNHFNTNLISINKYHQPVAGDTEKYINVIPQSVSGNPVSTYQGLKNYNIRDFGSGLDAVLQILGHIVINKFQEQWNGKADFWLKSIVLPVHCKLEDVAKGRKFSDIKPSKPEDIHPDFIESDERRQDVLSYTNKISRGEDVGKPLFISGTALNRLMEKPVADNNGIYMLDGARRISASALAHNDVIEILLIITDSEYENLLPDNEISKLKDKMKSLSWFNNYQSIPLIGLKGERSTNRFNLFDINLLKDQTVMDFGCNIGQASIVAAQAGAKAVIGIEGMPDTYTLAKDIKNLIGFDNLNYLNVDFNAQDFDKQIEASCPNKVDYSFFFSVYRTRELTQRERLFKYIINKTRKGIFFEGHADPKIDSIEFYDWLFDCFGLSYKFLGFSEANIRPLFYLPLQEKTIDQPTKQVEPITKEENVSQGNQTNPGQYSYLISAIISTYKSERFIKNKLDDLLSQTLVDSLEIIVIDSNSPENEREIIEQYAKIHKNIKYIRTESRETVYQAWNRGIKAASGKYVTNSNTDDRLRSDALETMVQVLESSPDIALVYANFFITGQENMTMERHIRTGYSVKPEFHPNIMLHGCHMGPQPVWRKQVHEKIGYFDENLYAAGDYEFWCRMAAAGYVFKQIPEFLGLYLHNTDGIINSDQTRAADESQLVREKYSKNFPPPAQDLPSGFYYQKTHEKNEYVNITVVTYNRLDFTKEALKSILAFTRFPYVLTVVDNNSTDGTPAYLQMLKDKNVITNLVLLDENIGVAKAANLGWTLEPDASYYLKYDNDIVIQNEAWIPDLINVLKSLPNAGAVGYNFEPVSYPSQTLNGLQVRPKEQGNLGGACICIPKSTHDILGFWNEEYGLYGEEDADYGFRIKQAGLLNIYMLNENIGVHLPAGRAAAIDQNMTARDGMEESVHAEYRQFKDDQRRENVLTGMYDRNIQAYQNGTKPLYVSSVFANNTPGQKNQTIENKSQLNVAMISVDQNENACPFIRLFSPLTILDNLHKINFTQFDLLENDKIDVEKLRSLDIIIVQRNAAKAVPYSRLRDAVKGDNVKIVYEFDDAFDKIPDDQLEAFKLYSSIQPEIDEYICKADLVTVSTLQLKKYYQQKNDNIAVLPNFLNDLVWKFNKPLKKDSGTIRILFSGTLGHKKDLQLIKSSLKKICKEFPDKVELLFWGNSDPELEKLSNVSKVNSFNPNYLQYAETLQSLDADFAVVPLVDNEFNRAKSHIKWMEYSACGIPGIFSKVGEYPEVIKNKETGIIVKNTSKDWYTALKWMINNPKKRDEIGLKAQKVVEENHTLIKNAYRWLDTYNALFEKENSSINTSDFIPHVSIIIPVFNKLNYTQKCIEAILKNTTDNYEIIFVDNGSTDGTDRYFLTLTKDKKNISYIKNDQNLGFAAANNIAANKAKGKYLVFLNNDTEVQQGWLDSMLSIAEQDNKVGAVGCKLLYPDKTIQHAGIVIINNKIQDDPLQAQNIFVGEKHDAEDPNILREYQAVTAACLLISKQKFEQADGFDEGFWNGYEDVDLCFKLKELGYKNIYQPKSEIIHYESQSGPERFKKAAENIQRLHQKWLGKISVDFTLNTEGTVIESEVVSIREYKGKAGSNSLVGSSQLEKVSIIMLTCNALEMTQKCVTSVLKNTSCPYEIIFVDNGSKDGTIKYLENLAGQNEHIRVIKNQSNRGFSAGNNQGARIAKGKYILLLNNDVLVGKNWLTDLVDAFEKDEHIGMVGVLTNKASGLQVLKGIPYKAENGFEDFATQWREKYHGQITPRRRLAGLAMLTSKKIYDSIGGFDESYGLGNFEDDDISLKIRKAGYALMVHEGTFIHHYAHSSFKANNIDLLESLKENEKIFKEKWPGVDYEELLELKNPMHEMHPRMIKKATELVEKYKYNEADQLYKQILELNPLAGDALLGMALSLNLQNKFEEALPYLLRAYKHFPENNVVLNQLGICYFQQGDFTMAENYFEKALQLDPDSSDLQKNYGRTLIENGKYEQGVSIFRAILQKSPEDTVACSYLAELYMEIEKFEDARDLLLRAKNADPADENITNLLDRVNMALNSSNVNEKMEENSVMENSLYLRAMDLLNDFKASDAEQFFQQSYEIEKNPDALFGLALCAVQKEQNIKAIAALKKLIEAYPSYAPAYNQLGMEYFKNADLENAKKFFAKAIENNPALISAQRNYGMCLIETGDYKNGMAVFDKILTKYPDDTETLLILAGYYCEIKKWNEAEKIIEKILNSDPQNEDANNLMNLVRENVPLV